MLPFHCREIHIYWAFKNEKRINLYYFIMGIYLKSHKTLIIKILKRILCLPSVYRNKKSVILGWYCICSFEAVKIIFKIFCLFMILENNIFFWILMTYWIFKATSFIYLIRFVKRYLLWGKKQFFTFLFVKKIPIAHFIADIADQTSVLLFLLNIIIVIRIS